MAVIDFDSLAAGKETDMLVAEHVLGWTWVQAPQWDYHGPLPEQGEVLASPEMRSSIERHEYQWPPSGVIPASFFVNGRNWSSKREQAMELLDRFKVWQLSRDGDGYYCEIGTAPKSHRYGYGYDKSAALAICKAALAAATDKEAPTQP